MEVNKKIEMLCRRDIFLAIWLPARRGKKEKRKEEYFLHMSVQVYLFEKKTFLHILLLNLNSLTHLKMVRTKKLFWALKLDQSRAFLEW